MPYKTPFLRPVPICVLFLFSWAVTAQTPLELEGAIQISDTDSTNIQAGTIRWNPDTEDFEGYNGSKWVSLTNYGSVWGKSDNEKIESSSNLNFNSPAGAWFGNSVGIDGDHAIVGAPNHWSKGIFESGKSYVFKRSGTDWILQAIMIASDTENNSHFANATGISGQSVIIGAAEKDPGGNTKCWQGVLF